MVARTDLPMDQIRAFGRAWPIRQLALFGSVLRDDFGPDSDVDVLVELQPDHHLSLFDWVDMIDELRAIFGRDVDLVSKTGLKNPIRRDAILQSAQVVYAA